MGLFTRHNRTDLTLKDGRTFGKGWDWNRGDYRELTQADRDEWEWDDVTWVGVPGEFRILVKGYRKADQDLADRIQRGGSDA